MEVCGGHTMAIHRFGLQSLLPHNIRLLSGPGCPVCVSSQHFIDTAIEYSKLPGIIITTYGDLIRVPGSVSSSKKRKQTDMISGSSIRCWKRLKWPEATPKNRLSSWESVLRLPLLPRQQPLSRQKKRKLSNFFVLSAHKVMPPVMKALVEEGIKIDGFIAPGHVSAITGTAIYNDLAAICKLGVVIAGFEPVDLMQAILMLVRQAESGSPRWRSSIGGSFRKKEIKLPKHCWQRFLS